MILNGADRTIFGPNEKFKWSQGKPLKLFSSLGGNRKGADIYELIDNFLDMPVWKNKLEFTYVKRSDGCNLRNTCVAPFVRGRVGSRISISSRICYQFNK